MQLAEEEQIQFDLKANLKRGIEYVGGNLKITNKKLYFKAHSFNIQKKELVISIKDIKKVDKARILGISPNGVLLQLKNDIRYKFTIGMPLKNKNQEIIDFIASLID